jgi:hypothetical protein
LDGGGAERGVGEIRRWRWRFHGRDRGRDFTGDCVEIAALDGGGADRGVGDQMVEMERRRRWDHAVTRWRICRRRRVLIGDGGFVGWLAEVVVGFLSIPVVLGCVLRVCFLSFYVAPNIVKYFRDYFPKCKQTLKKQSFSLKSFSFSNILRWRIFYIETNGALIYKH